MKTIFQIFSRDVKRLSHNFVAVIVIIGISIIPALYAWFNIAANFDPYSNTSGIKVAVSNKDKGYNSSFITLNAGEEIIQNLQKDSQLGWTFTDENTAIKGVRSGKYYSAIIIPEDFSSNMASILSGEIQSPKIQYYVNEKKNAIAPKITNTGADTLQTQVNSTFSEIVARTVSDTLNSTADNLSRNTGSLSGSITTALQETQQNLLDYQTAIQDFQLLCENANENVDSQRQVLVEARTVLSSGKEAVSNTQSLLKDSRSATASLTGTLGASVEQSSSLLGRLSQTSSSALSQLESGSMSAAGKAENILASVQSLLDINQECINLLEQLNSSLPIPLDSIDTLLEEFSAQAERQQGILDNLTETCLAVETTAQTSKETREKLSSLASEGQSKIEELHSTLQENLSPQLNNTLDNFNLTAGNLTGILTASETSLNSLPAVLDEMQDSLASISEAMADTSQVLASAKEHLEKIETEITTASSSELYQKLLSALTSDPEQTSAFMSSPVQLEKKTYYEIDTYGSAMAAFYTNLAIWVGGIVLIAILKFEVKPEKGQPRISPTAAYFGRYLLFMAIGLLQAFIICLGDLYLIHIQCQAPVLFVFAGLVCSFIYVNIIYALSITWKHIGKAMAVLLLVIQIPGSAGSYPIEVTPAFFQYLHPFLPFTYGVNAMRETIGGIYQNAYAQNLLHLLCFLPIALFIGLILRKPLLSLNSFFDRRLSETHLM